MIEVKFVVNHKPKNRAEALKELQKISELSDELINQQQGRIIALLKHIANAQNNLLIGDKMAKNQKGVKAKDNYEILNEYVEYVESVEHDEFVESIKPVVVKAIEFIEQAQKEQEDLNKGDQGSIQDYPADIAINSEEIGLKNLKALESAGFVANQRYSAAYRLRDRSIEEVCLTVARFFVSKSGSMFVPDTEAFSNFGRNMNIKFRNEFSMDIGDVTCRTVIRFDDFNNMTIPEHCENYLTTSQDEERETIIRVLCNILTKEQLELLTNQDDMMDIVEEINCKTNPLNKDDVDNEFAKMYLIMRFLITEKNIRPTFEQMRKVYRKIVEQDDRIISPELEYLIQDGGIAETSFKEIYKYLDELKKNNTNKDCSIFLPFNYNSGESYIPTLTWAKLTDIDTNQFNDREEPLHWNANQVDNEPFDVYIKPILEQLKTDNGLIGQLRSMIMLTDVEFVGYKDRFIEHIKSTSNVAQSVTSYTNKDRMEAIFKLIQKDAKDGQYPYLASATILRGAGCKFELSQKNLFDNLKIITDDDGFNGKEFTTDDCIKFFKQERMFPNTGFSPIYSKEILQNAILPSHVFYNKGQVMLSELKVVKKIFNLDNFDLNSQNCEKWKSVDESVKKSIKWRVEMIRNKNCEAIGDLLLQPSDKKSKMTHKVYGQNQKELGTIKIDKDDSRAEFVNIYETIIEKTALQMAKDNQLFTEDKYKAIVMAMMCAVAEFFKIKDIDVNDSSKYGFKKLLEMSDFKNKLNAKFEDFRVFPSPSDDLLKTISAVTQNCSAGFTNSIDGKSYSSNKGSVTPKKGARFHRFAAICGEKLGRKMTAEFSKLIKEKIEKTRVH